MNGTINTDSMTVAEINELMKKLREIRDAKYRAGVAERKAARAVKDQARKAAQAERERKAKQRKAKRAQRKAEQLKAAKARVAKLEKELKTTAA